MRTCWDEDVGGNADSCQQQRSRHAGPPSDDLEEQVDDDFGWHLDGRVDEVCEEHVQAEPSDVQTDPIVCGCDSKPAQTRGGGRNRSKTDRQIERKKKRVKEGGGSEEKREEGRRERKVRIKSKRGRRRKPMTVFLENQFRF